MARNKTLLSILNSYRLELEQSSNPAHNAGARDAQVNALQRTQERLYQAHDWPHLRVFRFIDLQAGQRYYDPRGAELADGTPAADLGVERLEAIEVRWGDEWISLCPGITAAQYSVWDSDLDARSEPVERWQIFEDEMIEIWPIPVANADPVTLNGRLRLTGIRDLRPFVADDDRADLDDDLIIKFTAARALARRGGKDAQIVLDEAKTIEIALTGNFSKRKSFSLGGAEPVRRQPRGPWRVHYRDNEPGA